VHTFRPAVEQNRRSATRNQHNTKNVAQVRLHDLTSANLLVELPRRFRRFQREFVAELPLTQTVLMYGQMRLVKASVAAHKHAVYLLTAHLTVGEALADRNAALVLAELETYLRNPIECLKVLQPELFTVKKRPVLERRIFK
jgi:hypothetical protein